MNDSEILDKVIWALDFWGNRQYAPSELTVRITVV